MITSRIRTGRWRYACYGLAVVAVVVGGGFLIVRNWRAPAPPVTKAAPPASTDQPLPQDNRALPAVSEETRALREQRWDDLLDRARAAIDRGPEQTQMFVHALYAALDALPHAQRIEAILGFFESGRDIHFGSAFAIGRDGFLTDWPTLRVALFDYLAQRDRAAVRALAEDILRTRPTEPGEWTLAMRELARGRRAEEWPPLLAGRVRDFITDSEWAQTSAPSWLEGFDIIVAGHATEFLPDLSRLASRESRATRFAAFLATDRLMLTVPAATLRRLNQEPDLLATEPRIRAGIFARADVRDPIQVRELEAYFARNDLGAEEMSEFGELFPLYDLAVSQNLLSSTPSRNIAEMLAQDRAALSQIERWLADPRVVAWQAPLHRVAERLDEHLASALPTAP